MVAETKHSTASLHIKESDYKTPRYKEIHVLGVAILREMFDVALSEYFLVLALNIVLYMLTWDNLRLFD